ncbi:MAG: hypothetical protein MI742_15320, partial [Desulfobacterales bacterium]|nr:hypothetical protein [Desulfobacterales bacterium]
DSPHPSKVGLTLDKTSYTPGETVRVKIIPPADGEALVMVEGKRLLWAKRLSVKNTGTIVDIPVESTWKSHDIYISAVVLRKTEAREAETPLRSLGVVHLPFNREDRNLTLSVASPTVWQKEAPMPVAVTAVNHAGDPVSAKVWVAAVDVGILSITGYSSPNPFEWFFARRWYGVQSRDIYGKVVEIEPSMAAALRFGGDGDMTLGGGKPQVEVKLFSKVFGPFETDRSGRVQMDIPMDDFSGKIRLMAVAFDARRFGSTEKEATVTPPLVVQLSTPRFMAPEDTSLVTVDVTRMVEGEGQYEISATAQGPICVDGESKFLTLSEKKRKIITWPISAVCDATHPAFGVGEIRVTASGEGVTKTISRQFAVRPGYPGEAREKRVRIKPGETIQLKDEAMKGLMPVTVGGGVTVSNRLPLNTDSYVQGLLQYPYGCLEQTTSRAFPQLWLVPDVAQVMGVKALAPSKRREILNKAVARIISMQRHNGSFGLWSSSSPEDPWLSCYATDFLLSARSMGVDVPIQALRKALGRQRSWLVKGVGGDLRGDHGAVFAVKSYAAFNLSRAQSSHLASMRTLADNHLDDAADMLSAVRLALALQQSGDTRRSGVVAEKALAIKTDHDTWRRDYGSDVRDLAMGMALLNSAKLLPDAMTGLLDKLEDELRKTWWLSTQEKAALFFLSLSGSQAQQKVSLSLVEKGETRLFHEKGPFTANLSAESLEKEGISITNTGEQGLYLSSVVTGYNKKAPEKESKDILVRREYFTMAGHLVAPEDMRKVKAGSVFLVNLRVTATQRIPDALVVDFLPAGFEIENPNFENSIHADETKVRGRKVWRHQEESRITHAEYLEDRFVAAVELSKNREFNLFYVVRAVSPGRFTVPPPFAESMYKPEIRGIGESGEVVEVGEMKL